MTTQGPESAKQLAASHMQWAGVAKGGKTNHTWGMDIIVSMNCSAMPSSA